VRRALFLILLFVATTGYAQRHFIGFKVGGSMTNVTTERLFESTNDKLGVVTGISYEFMVSDQFSIGVDALYTQRGFKDDFYQLQNGELDDTKFSYNYIALPLKGTFVTKSKTYVILAAGFVPAFLVKAETKTPEFDNNPSQTTTTTDQVTSFDLAGLLELGCGYKISDRFHIYTTLSGQLSFTTFTNDDYFSIVEGKHYGFAFTAGVKYALPSKVK
jgi:hypothetical protein